MHRAREHRARIRHSLSAGSSRPRPPRHQSRLPLLFPSTSCHVLIRVKLDLHVAVIYILFPRLSRLALLHLLPIHPPLFAPAHPADTPLLFSPFMLCSPLRRAHTDHHQSIQTVTGVTGGAGAPVGNALTSLGNGVQDGGDRVAQGVKDAGAGKKEWW